jgi:hypothetical protein
MSFQTNLQISRASVEVQVQGGVANLDGSEVLLVVVLGRGNGRTANSSSVNVGRHSTTVLGQCIGVQTRQVDSLSAGSSLLHLVHTESSARALDGHSGSRGNGRKAGEAGGNFAEDNHGDDSIERWIDLMGNGGGAGEDRFHKQLEGRPPL